MHFATRACTFSGKVRSVPAVAAIVVMSTSIGGCASIAGLTSYSDVDCTGADCDASADATADAHAGDATPASDGAAAVEAAGGDATDSSLSQDVVVVDVTPADVGSSEGATCPASCATTCTTHDNGVGQNYYDCDPLYSSNNPWTQAAALEACTALTGEAAKCTVFNCSGTHSICSSGSIVCDCWEFSGPQAGHVNASGNCDCVLATDPTWD
jgi:hypothetical protein